LYNKSVKPLKTQLTHNDTWYVLLLLPYEDKQI